MQSWRVADAPKNDKFQYTHKINSFDTAPKKLSARSRPDRCALEQGDLSKAGFEKSSSSDGIDVKSTELNSIHSTSSTTALLLLIKQAYLAFAKALYNTIMFFSWQRQHKTSSHFRIQII
ncbi:hypothetical protein V6N13_081057 [Hibiscus sabdariffa]|uniref:Uncharacterized protein n=1 Tax=Hibiscus sabdariffa TaxID=183260 RepID=A0ABR2DE79_9ROSI